MASTSVINRFASPIVPQSTITTCGSVALGVISGTSPFSITIPIPGMTATGLIDTTYIHPAAGGAGQWIWNIVPGVDSVVVSFGQSPAVGETLVFQVLRFA